MKTIKIYTDGACASNNLLDASKRAGGYAWVVAGTEQRTCYSAKYIGADSTNNKMEMLAAISALRSVSQKAKVILALDSAYVQTSIEGRDTRLVVDDIIYLKTGKPAKNCEELLELYKEIDRIRDLGGSVIVEKVRGHIGDPDNEAADRLAKARAAQVMLGRK